MEVIKKLDKLLIPFSQRVIEEIGISENTLNCISSTIYEELNQLSCEDISKIKSASSVEFEQIFNMLISFDNTYKMVTNNDSKLDPNTRRDLVQYTFYMLFVYLKDNCFDISSKVCKNGSVTKRLCKYLLSAEIRALRNALAHGNWVTEFRNKGKDPTNNVIYYSKKEGLPPNMKLSSGVKILFKTKSQLIDSDKDKIIASIDDGYLLQYTKDDQINLEPDQMIKYTKTLDDIYFYQTVTRVTAYTIYTFVKNYKLDNAL